MNKVFLATTDCAARGFSGQVSAGAACWLAVAVGGHLKYSAPVQTPLAPPRRHQPAAPGLLKPPERATHTAQATNHGERRWEERPGRFGKGGQGQAPSRGRSEEEQRRRSQGKESQCVYYPVRCRARRRRTSAALVCHVRECMALLVAERVPTRPPPPPPHATNTHTHTHATALR